MTTARPERATPAQIKPTGCCWKLCKHSRRGSAQPCCSDTHCVSPAVFASTVEFPAARAAVAAAGKLSCSKASVTPSAISDRAAIQTINTAVLCISWQQCCSNNELISDQKNQNYFCRDSKIFSVPIYLVEVIKSESQEPSHLSCFTSLWKWHVQLASAELYKLTCLIHRENQFLPNNGSSCLAVQN